jgi:dethiobiotin synthetase
MEQALKLFVTGIGTGVGKTLASAILAEALNADYWKPVQTGLEEGTDASWIRSVRSNPEAQIYPETYLFKLPASPHIAAREAKSRIDPARILEQNSLINRSTIIEGAGGILVPLNEQHFMADLIKMLGTKLVLVSRNYLGSINHSLLTARLCRQMDIPVAGWVFSDQFMDYEQEITDWSGYPKLFSIPFTPNPDKDFVQSQAAAVRESLIRHLC